MGGMSTSGVLRAIAPLVDGIDTQQIDLVELTVHRDDPGVELTLDLPGQDSPDRWTVTATPAATTTPAGTATTTGDASTEPLDSSQAENFEGITPDSKPGCETDGPTDGGRPASSDDRPADAESPLLEAASTVAQPPTWPTATQVDPAPPSVRPATRSDGGATQARRQSHSVPCRVGGCDRAFDSQQAMRVHAAKAHAVEDNPERAAHRDPERLEAVYAAHDTFAEMRDALGVEVTTQTVRRNMMKFGVHTPAGNPDEQSQSEDTGEVGAGASMSADQSEGSKPSGGHSGSTERAEASVSASPSGQGASGESQRESDATEGSVEMASELEREIRSVSLPGDVVVPPGTTVGDLVAAIQSADSPVEFRRALELGRGETQLLLSVLDVQPSEVAAGERGRQRLVTAVVEMLESSVNK